MKRSKRKSNSTSSTKRSSTATTQRQPVEPHSPSAEAWSNIVRDFRLTSAQAETLKITLEEALEGISRYRGKLDNRPSRPLLIERLKTFKKVLGEFRDECRRSADLIHDFLPHDVLEYIGRSLTFSAMSEALERKVFPRNFDLKMELKRLSGERITLAWMEEFSRPSREALGLNHGHLILKYFIEHIHKPLAKWIELKSFDEGGRPADVVRRYLIYKLAEAAPEVIGKAATVASTGKFVDLCTSVLQACGLPETGIAKAIPAVVSKLREDQAKWRRRAS
jgi:hypothetical protein